MLESLFKLDTTTIEQIATDTTIIEQPATDSISNLIENEK
jgi:hypothetical protein